MRTGDLCQLAADLASEHGAAASDYARRAIVSLVLDDIVAHRLDPDRPIVVH
jgi:hypothetical protein